MVLDIRKDLLQRKQKSQPKSSTSSNPREGLLVRDSEPAETIEGPFSPPCSYDPLVFNLHNSLYRKPQPRPLRVPCFACTFVPHAKHPLALSRNGLPCQSQPPFHHKELPAAASHEECSTIDEEPCAEDIAGDHHSFTGAKFLPSTLLSKSFGDFLLWKRGSKDCQAFGILIVLITMSFCNGGIAYLAGCRVRIAFKPFPFWKFLNQGQKRVSLLNCENRKCWTFKYASPYSPQKIAVECVASTQPIRVACSACTSSLRAPLFYGHAAVAPKVKTRKRAKNPKGSSTEAMAMATIDCPAQDLQASSREAMAMANADCPVQDLQTSRDTAGEDYGWFVRPDRGPSMRPSGSAVVRRSSRSTAQGPCMRSSGSATVQRSSQKSAALEKKKGLNAVPVEVDAVHNVEVVEGHSSHESIAVTYQATRSCEDISDIVHVNTELAAGEKKLYKHDCFVKRVERACAKVTGSKEAAADRSRLPRNRPRPSSSMSRHEWQKNTANMRASRMQHNAALARGDGQYDATVVLANQAEDEGAVSCEQGSDLPQGAVDNSDAANHVIQAMSDIAAMSIQENSRRKRKSSRQSRKEDTLGDLQKHKSTSQEEDLSVVVQPRVSMAGASASEKNDEKICTFEGEAGAFTKERSISATPLCEEHAGVSQITCFDIQMVKKSGEHEEETKKEQPLRLSVEVFPSPSAPKGFGLKIVQHFPKTVDVEYVNGLGLSPRSFQTLPCQQCSSSCPPLKL